MSKKGALKELRRANRMLAEDLSQATALAERANSTARDWRAKYEALLSSPEIKADTEAAFMRGAEHMKRSVASYLSEQIRVMEVPRES